MELIDVLLAVEAGEVVDLPDLGEAIEGGFLTLETVSDQQRWVLVSEARRVLEDYHDRVATARQIVGQRIADTVAEGWAVYAHNVGDPDASVTFGRDDDVRWSRAEAEEHAVALALDPEGAGHRLWLEAPTGYRIPFGHMGLVPA